MKRFSALLLFLIVVVAAMGATVTRVDFDPLAPVKLVKPSGVVYSYGTGAATSTAVGTALQSAITASAAGDIVWLSADATVTATVGKDELHLEMTTGASLTGSSADTLSTVSDDSGECDMYIHGGRIVRANNGKGAAVKITNASSNITIHCDEIVNEKTAIGASPDKPNLEGCALFVDGGTSYVDAQLISGTFGAWWDAGDSYVKAAKIIGSGSAAYSLALYAEPDAAETGQWWVDCPHIKAPTPMLLRTATGTGTARIWIQSSLIEGSGIDVPKILIDNVFAYITCQKIVANQPDTSYLAGWIDVSGGAHFYLTTQKISTDGGGDGAFINVSETGTVAYLTIDEVDDANGLPGLGFLQNTTASTYYTGKACNLTTASRDAFSNVSGSLFVQSGNISTQSSCKDLIRSAGTLTVSPGVKYDSSKTTGTITLQPVFGTTPSAFGLTLWDDANAAALRTTIGLGSGDSPTFAGATLVGASQSAIELDRTLTTDYARTMFQTASVDQWGAGLRGDAATNNDWELYDEVNSRHLIVGKLSGRVGILNTSPATALDVTGTVTSTGLALSSAGTLGWASKSIISSPADSAVLVTNAAGTDFSRIQLGGTTSSFPSLKRSGTFLHSRLADDSGYASFACLNLSATGTAITLSGLPTSDPAVAGVLYLDGTIVKASGATAGNIDKRVATIIVTDPATAVTTGDGKVQFRIPAAFNGMNLVDVEAGCTTVSSSGIPTVQLRRSRRSNATTRSDADMLSTKSTIDQSEFDSVDAAAAEVINASNDDVATGDMILVDVDVAGTGCMGLTLNLTFQMP